MPYGATPPSQKNRRISFDLSGGGAGGTVDLVIRPEELTRVEPSRLSVQQTLAGAWADAFDRGVATIRISGHTGWHGGPARGSTGLSGEQQFQNLRTTSFQGWHDARAAVVAGGGDPAVVEMIFVDELDRFSALVAPKVFTLRRSKTRPLLMMYVIELLVLQDLGDPGPGGGGGGGPGDFIGQLFGDFLGGANALQGLAGQITGVVAQANGIVGGAQGVAGQLASGNLLGAVSGAQGLVGQIGGAANNASSVGQAAAGAIGDLLGGLF